MKTQSMVVTQSSKCLNANRTRFFAQEQSKKRHMQSIVYEQHSHRESEMDNIQFNSKASHHQSVVVHGNNTTRTIVDPIGPQRTKLQAQANQKDNTHDEDLQSEKDFAKEDNDVSSASTLGSERNKKVSDIFVERKKKMKKALMPKMTLND